MLLFRISNVYKNLFCQLIIRTPRSGPLAGAVASFKPMVTVTVSGSWASLRMGVAGAISRRRTAGPSVSMAKLRPWSISVPRWPTRSRPEKIA